MKTTVYLLIALLVFIATITGSDLFARVSIAGESLAPAFDAHLQWASQTAGGLVFLLTPFAASAWICAFTNKRARTRSAAAIFCVSMVALGAFYFAGFQAAQHALQEKHWTAAALSIGLLPFFIGIPALAAVAMAAAIAARFDRRPVSQATP